ncbi:hypothetical protein Tco_1354928 [Tanacetum coccineum]
MTEFPKIDSGLAVLVFNQGDDPIACLNKAMAFLMVVSSSRFLLELPPIQETKPLFKMEGLLYNKFKGGKDKFILTEDLDAYDSDCDDVSNAKAVLMANLSNYGSDDFEQILVVDFSNNEIHSDSNIISYSQFLQETQQPWVFYDDTHKQALGYQNPFYIKKAQWIKPTLYDGSVISKQHVASYVFDDEETLILEEIEAVVQQYFVDKQCFKIHKKKLFLENDRLLQNNMSQDVMICVMNSIAAFDDVNMEMQSSESCVKYVDLDAELLNKQYAYNDLLKSYSQLEKHCISLELTMQLNQEIFQKDSLSNNQNVHEIPEYFENNDLKAQLQAKDTTICKLKDHIKSMR